MLAALWQMRWIITTLLVLWTIGLIAGAIHPLGYLAVVIEVAALTWFFLTRGMLVSVQAKDLATATGISAACHASDVLLRRAGLASRPIELGAARCGLVAVR